MPMHKPQVLITDHGFPDVEIEKRVIVNTARGALIDTRALADALQT